MGLAKPIVRVGLAAALAVGMPAGLSAQSDSTPSTGVFKTAQQMFDLCTSRSEADLEQCDWFIMGAHDMIKLYGDTGTGGLTICIPIGTKELEVRNAVISYWRTRRSLSFSAVSTIYNALTAAYPC